MNRVARVPGLTVATAMWVFVAPQAVTAQSASSLFQQALHEEEVVGDLSAAIGLYQRVADEFPGERALVARALIRIGSSYEKMGDRKAQEAYERVVRDFSDQRVAASEASARLAALDVREVSRGASSDGRPNALDGRLLPPVSVADFDAWTMSISSDRTRALFGAVGTVGELFVQAIGMYDYRDGSTTWMTDSGSAVAADGTIGLSAVWSPDGEALAYATAPYYGPERTAKVWVVRLGEARQAVFEASSGESVDVHDWFHDGSGLVVTVRRADGSRAIGTVSLPEGRLRQLRTLNWDYATSPRISPDGRTIVFEDGTRDTRDLYLLATDGSSLVPLDQHPAFDSGPLWSPDGTHVLFRSDRQGQEGVWAVPVADGAPAGAPFLVMDGADGVALQDWISTGLVYHRSVTLDDIYTAGIEPSTGRVTRAPEMLSYARTGGNFQPSFSPDGRYIAFLSGESRGGSAQRSLVIAPTGGGDPIIAGPPGDAALYLLESVRWKPDGSELSAISRDQQSEAILLRFALADRSWSVDPLPDSLRFQSFDLDPSWQHVFYYFYTGRVADLSHGLVESDLATGEDVLLWTPPIAPIRSITASPDGTRIAMTVRQRLWIYDRDEGTAAQLPEVRVLPGLSWSPDGRYLAYVGNDEPDSGPAETSDGEPRLRVLEVATGVSREPGLDASLLARVPQGQMQESFLTTPAWSADGSAIAFTVQGHSEEVRVFEGPLDGVGRAGTARRSR